METKLHEDQQYHGEFRYVNLPPQTLRAKLAEEKDPKEQDAIRLALLFWEIKSGKVKSGTSAGEPYRGDKREAIHAKSMAELAKAVNPVEHVFVQGELTHKGDMT